MTEKDLEELLHDARSVLAGNWVELPDETGFTKPAAKVYPYQWNWDSGFAAIGHSHFDTDRAIQELENLFSGQWKNGMLPHIVFHTESRDYFPDQSFWQASKVNHDAPQHLETSGMTQPPVHALAVWRIYEKLEKNEPKRAKTWLEKMYPRLYKLHRYFYVVRDQDNAGLVTIYHPWESGMDNSPRWDEPLERLEIDTRPRFERQDTNLVDPRFRPSDDSYDKFVYLAEHMRALDYDDKKLQDKHPFQVEDIFLSAILHLATQHLIDIANVLGRDTEELQKWQERFADNLLDRCWDNTDGLCYDYDRRSNSLINTKTIATIAPMISGVITERTANWLFDALDVANYCGDHSCSNTLLPSTSLTEATYQPEVYWRGPVWINVNWLLWIGLKNAGHDERAKSVRLALVRCLKENGIWEYYTTETLDGIGADKFTWSAALAIDILSS